MLMKYKYRQCIEACMKIYWGHTVFLLGINLSLSP